MLSLRILSDTLIQMLSLCVIIVKISGLLTKMSDTNKYKFKNGRMLLMLCPRIRHSKRVQFHTLSLIVSIVLEKANSIENNTNNNYQIKDKLNPISEWA